MEQKPNSHSRSLRCSVCFMKVLQHLTPDFFWHAEMPIRLATLVETKSLMCWLGALNAFATCLKAFILIKANLGWGEHPSHDPWGRAFGPSYCAGRFAKAGSRIAGPYYGVFDGVQGDADFVAHLFKLKRLLVELRSVYPYALKP